MTLDRVLRGSAWHSIPQGSRVSYRFISGRDYCYYITGVRLSRHRKNREHDVPHPDQNLVRRRRDTSLPEERRKDYA